jgi:LysR family nod box-dependent transcriptional activator
MHLNGLDLNLLVALDELLSSRSVSRAAERLNLSQPAMSAALSRLREYFQDDLLVLHGKKMFPTDYAEHLTPLVKDCLNHAQAVIRAKRGFDPLTSQRTFHVVASDYITAVTIVPLVERLALAAPQVQLDIAFPSTEAYQQLRDGKIDLLISPAELVPAECPHELLFEEDHVVVGWAGNPIFKKPLTEERFFAAGHVGVALGSQRQLVFADQALHAMNKPRRIEVVAPSFASVPWLLLNTSRISVMHERLARSMAKYFPIRIVPLPFELPKLQEAMAFHSTRRSDDGLRWLREQFHAAAGSAAPASRGGGARKRAKVRKND